MGLTENIVLWTTSLFLALSGISFGIIASVNASRANKNIKSLISTSWISDESQKYFFENLKKTSNENKKVVKFLTNNNPTYFDYTLKASGSRMSFMPYKLIRELLKTEHKDTTEMYSYSKKERDKSFKEIVVDLKILQSNNNIPEDIQQKLINYHHESNKVAVAIMKRYSVFSSKPDKER